MSSIEDLTNRRYGKLLVLYPSETLVRGVAGRLQWFCMCDCGIGVMRTHKNLIGNKSVSCGCGTRKHSMAGTRQHNIWMAMRRRCNNPKDSAYKYYGGKGVTVSARWDSFENFWEDMSDGYSDKLELDRIDVNGAYCKENCRWVTHELQVINRGIQSNNTSGRTGVRKPKNSDKWVATIQFKNTVIHLGSFISFTDAVNAREIAEMKYFGFIKE